tara:strand:- start:373 stop:573 length:201 start_codon:yes stop_codon:yes gene_type:complete
VGHASIVFAAEQGRSDNIRLPLNSQSIRRNTDIGLKNLQQELRDDSLKKLQKQKPSASNQNMLPFA